MIRQYVLRRHLILSMRPAWMSFYLFMCMIEEVPLLRWAPGAASSVVVLGSRLGDLALRVVQSSLRVQESRTSQSCTSTCL